MAKQTKAVAKLKKLRNDTLADIEDLRTQMQAEIEPASDSDDDSVDVASDIYERGKMLSLIQSLEDKLHNIEHAITIANSGRYGKCESCGIKIPGERLEILPETTLCVACANKLEQGIRRQRIQMADDTPREYDDDSDDEYGADDDDDFEEEADNEL
ncbi:MAG: hypothetical protein GXY52_00035 [Chloroflexi bacterium]|nr:hypothetical protein [Chloroflexota bacterium]